MSKADLNKLYMKVFCEETFTDANPTYKLYTTEIWLLVLDAKLGSLVTTLTQIKRYRSVRASSQLI